MATDVNRQGRIDYDYDEHGTNPDNYVKNERYTVSNTRYRDSNIIVPEFSPFFADGVKVRYKKNANANIVELKVGEGFELSLLYKGADRVLGKPVFGAILLNDLDLDGQLWIDYRTVGGEQIQDKNMVLNKLIEYGWNPRETLWDAVTDSPKAFPPHKHVVNWEELMKLDDLIKAMDNITKAVASNGEKTVSKLDLFLKSFDPKKYMEQVDKLDNHTYTELLNENKILRAELNEFKARVINLEKKL